MEHASYEYRAEQFDEPPTSECLNGMAVEGWKLVAVTVDVTPSNAVNPRYVAYLERPTTAAVATSVDVPLEATGKKRMSSSRPEPTTRKEMHLAALVASG